MENKLNVLCASSTAQTRPQKIRTSISQDNNREVNQYSVTGLLLVQLSSPYMKVLNAFGACKDIPCFISQQAVMGSNTPFTCHRMAD